MVRTTHSYAFGATGTTGTSTIHANGFINVFHLTCPNFTNAVTTTMSIADTDGTTIWTDSARNENATYLVDTLSIPVDYNYTLTFTLSGVAGAGGGTVSVKYYIKESE